MKKSARKLKLHRETLSHLETAALEKVAGAVTIPNCLSSPFKCFLTGGQQTCER